MKVLIAGGAGFIGSTIASACLDAGITPVVLDNLSTGRIEFVRDRAFYQGDIADGDLLDRIFAEHPDIAAVVHCAALIVVPDSVERPLDYYRENVAKGLEFVRGLLRNGCTRLIFSSSASLYGTAADHSVDEDSPLEPLSPYARTKMVFELALRDVAAATGLRVLSLRYFNPIGADPQLRTGVQGAAPSHALGRMIRLYEAGEVFEVTGADWDTRDGSGLRDYVHVWDLAQAHVRALTRFDDVVGRDDYRVINLGTGSGTTVFELLSAFNAEIDGALAHTVGPRRPGDSAGAFSRGERAARELNWRPERDLAAGIRDTLRWFARRGEVLGGPGTVTSRSASSPNGRP